jgi:putative ABC transport system substrate-binding protein
LARPGGNITGFTQFEYRISAKWLELLKELAPNMLQAAVIRNPETGPGIGQFAVIQALAGSMSMSLSRRETQPSQ